jgi:hypothetical protein
MHRCLPLGVASLGLACSATSTSTLGAGSGVGGSQSESGGSTGGAGGSTQLKDPSDAHVGTLVVDTTCGLEVTDACPNDQVTDRLCGLEEAVLALHDQKSEYGCDWSGTIGLNDTIVIPNSGTFEVTTSLRISSAVTIMSSAPGTLATIQGIDGTDLFGVDPVVPVSITFQDLHLVGAGQGLLTQSSGLSISGATADPGGTINVTRCWIEGFSNGAIVASDVNLNVTDSTLDSNSNDYGDGGGGIFYGTNGDAGSQVDFLTITNSSITHNHSTKGGGIQIQSNSISRIINSTISDNVTDGGHGGGISFANNAGPLANGVLRIVGSTIAFNGSTMFEGAGIAAGANQALFPENVKNQIYLTGSVIANNCLGEKSLDGRFACLSPNDVAGEIYELQDSLLGSTSASTIVGPDRGGWGRDGVTFVDVDAGLDSELTDQGGVGGHHPKVHMLKPDSIAVDATDGLKTLNAFDQTHRLRGFDQMPHSGPKVFDLGAAERGTNP